MGDYYTPTTYPVNSADGRAIDLRAELQAIGAGFAKLPAYTGNPDELVLVNPAGTGLTTNPTGKYKMSQSWTPTLVPFVLGDLNVVYSANRGVLHQVGQLVLVQFEIVTSTWTWTTASGNLSIAGLPNISNNIAVFPGALTFRGITKANYTQFAPTIGTSNNVIVIQGCGSAQPDATLVMADFPTGGSVVLRGSLWFLSQS